MSGLVDSVIAFGPDDSPTHSSTPGKEHDKDKTPAEMVVQGEVFRGVPYTRYHRLNG